MRAFFCGVCVGGRTLHTHTPVLILPPPHTDETSHNVACSAARSPFFERLLHGRWRHTLFAPLSPKRFSPLSPAGPERVRAARQRSAARQTISISCCFYRRRRRARVRMHARLSCAQFFQQRVRARAESRQSRFFKTTARFFGLGARARVAHRTFFWCSLSHAPRVFVCCTLPHFVFLTFFGHLDSAPPTRTAQQLTHTPRH